LGDEVEEEELSLVALGLFGEVDGLVADGSLPHLPWSYHPKQKTRGPNTFCLRSSSSRS